MVNLKAVSQLVCLLTPLQTFYPNTQEVRSFVTDNMTWWLGMLFKSQNELSGAVGSQLAHSLLTCWLWSTGPSQEEEEQGQERTHHDGRILPGHLEHEKEKALR